MPPSAGSQGGKKKKNKGGHAHNHAAVHAVQPVKPVEEPVFSETVDPISEEKEKAKESCLNEEQLLIEAAAAAPEEKEQEQRDIDIEETENVSPEMKRSAEQICVTGPVKAVQHSPRPSMPPPVKPATPRAQVQPQTQRVAPPHYSKGQVVKPQPVTAGGVVTALSDLAGDVMPASGGGTHLPPPPEPVEWVELHRIEKAGDRHRSMNVVVMGLQRGFQIWVVQDNGDCEEVLSERQGPLRVGRPLPNCPESINGAPAKDRFAVHRPLFALVDAAVTQADKQFCNVSFLSLAAGKVAHHICFDEPVSALHASTKLVAVSLYSSVVVFDALTLQEVHRVCVAPPPDGSPPVAALSHNCLAYADTRLNADVQSCGGMSGEEAVPPTTAGQMISVAKSIGRTVTSLGESVTGVPASSTVTPAGICTVVAIGAQGDEPRTVAHWPAQQSALSHVAWSADGRLVATANASATALHVFLLQPHATNSRLASVQQLYRLSRGTTPAKIVSSSFSLDSRWLAVCTNHGTTHVFAVCPYGGPPTQRTHGDRLTNRDSRFLRSAGLSEDAARQSLAHSRNRTASGATVVNREHPCARRGGMARASGNPRIGPHPPPILLLAVEKIKGSRPSADNITAWASDLAPALGTAKRRVVEPPRASVQWCAAGILRVARASAPSTLTEYELRPGKAAHPDEELSRVDADPVVEWLLTRLKTSLDVRSPLQPGSPLMQWAKHDLQAATRSEWIPQVEVQTYSAPHRRLWQGPQFVFRSYVEDTSEKLVAPSESRASLRSIPVVIGSGSRPLSIRGDEATTRIECGSWASEADYRTDDGAGDVSQKIADAMRDIEFEDKKPNSAACDEFYDASSAVAQEQDDDLLQFDDF